MVDKHEYNNTHTNTHTVGCVKKNMVFFLLALPVPESPQRTMTDPVLLVLDDLAWTVVMISSATMSGVLPSTSTRT